MERIRLSLRVALIMAGVQFPVKIREESILIGYPDKFSLLSMIAQIPKEAGEWTLESNNGEYSLTLKSDEGCRIKLQPIAKVYTDIDEKNKMLYD